MLEAARAMRENKEKRDKWRQQLDRVLGDGSGGGAAAAAGIPKRTVPKEFNLTSPRPKSAAPASVASDATPTKPLAQSVSEFTKTPKRFRGKGPNAAPSPMPEKRGNVVTKPTGVHLESAARAAAGRAAAVKSTAERELEYIASRPKFKARPVSRKVLESSGDLGVPRIQPRATTALREFNLSSASASRGKAARGGDDDDAASDAGSTASAPAAYKFKARPVPKSVAQGSGRAGLAQVTPRKTTRPVSPKLSTSARADLRPEPPAPAEPEPFAAFKARPMPDMSASPSPLKPSPARRARPLTEPRPFNLASISRHELAEQQRRAALAEAARREAEQRNFKATPMMMVDKAWTPTVEARHTDPKGFTLTTDARYELHRQALDEKVSQGEAERKAKAEFKARPPTVLSAPAFAPKKSTKPLTEIASGNIPFAKSEAQGAKRRELERQMAARRAAIEAAAAEKAKADAAAAAAEVARLRKTLVHKARPANVLKAAPFVVSKGPARSLTVPKSPAFATTSRSALRAAGA